MVKPKREGGGGNSFMAEDSRLQYRRGAFAKVQFPRRLRRRGKPQQPA